MKNLIYLIFAFILIASCQSNSQGLFKGITSIQKVDTISISQEHQPNYITGDFDGDNQIDSAFIVQGLKSKKFGLQIKFANKKTENLGMGKDILNLGFDDLDWVGVFEKVSKGNVYWDNIDENGDFFSVDSVKQKDKIKLPNDGILIHEAEACGGGIIYMKNKKFKWIVQD